MSRRLELRLDDIEQNIGHIRQLMTGRDLQSLAEDRFVRAAYERNPHIPWRAIADTGNILRHVYHSVDTKVLWAIHEKDIAPLHQAIQAIRADVAARSGR